MNDLAIKTNSDSKKAFTDLIINDVSAIFHVNEQLILFSQIVKVY